MIAGVRVDRCFALLDDAKRMVAQYKPLQPACPRQGEHEGHCRVVMSKAGSQSDAIGRIIVADGLERMYVTRMGALEVANGNVMARQEREEDEREEAQRRSRPSKKRHGILSAPWMVPVQSKEARSKGGAQRIDDNLLLQL